MQWEVCSGDRTLFIVDAATEADAKITVTNVLNNTFWNLGQLTLYPIPEKEAEPNVQVEDLRGTETD